MATTRQIRLLLLAVPAILFCPSLTPPTSAAPANPLPPDHAERMSRGLVLFDQTIRTLLTDQCVRCHGGEKIKGELDLNSREGLLKGGAHGSVVDPFSPNTSRMLRILHHQEEPFMPDPNSGKKLDNTSLSALQSWIEDGAPYSRHLIEGKSPPADRSKITDLDRAWWSFQPLASVPVPPSQATSKSKSHHPIDLFLEDQAARSRPGSALALNLRADPVSLLRRAHLDLTGIPPTPAEVASFQKDASPEAWNKWISQLLASPQYGERWARHWLDLARFAESSGFEHDYDREGAFHYRDFVIRALNQDLPYDQFVQWQLAGDEIAPKNPLALTATGFLGAGVFPTQITANEVERTRYDALDDMLSTSGSAFLGLSFGCARCHDHKYDPIPAQDYYRMLSTFTTTVRSVIDLDLDPEGTQKLELAWAEQRDALLRKAGEVEKQLKVPFETWLRADPSQDVTPSSPWIILPFTNLVSKAGATFKELPDQSILVSGKNGDRDDYTLTGYSPLGKITALRLEALPDPSMTKGGPGRAENGNFALSKIQAWLTSPSSTEKRELLLKNPKADFEQNTNGLSVASSLDDHDNTGWAVDPQFGKPHSAVFTLAEPISEKAGSTFTIQLSFHVNTRHNIGRFRVSLISTDPSSITGDPLPAIVFSSLQKRGSSKALETLALEDRKELFGWWKLNRPEWTNAQSQLALHDSKKPNRKSKVLICGEGYPPLRMHTQGSDFFKETYQLRRGNVDMKNGVAEPGFLQVLNRASPADAQARWTKPVPAGAMFSGRRTAFAHWMTDTEQGAGSLLARVIVNRLWQHHFGRGIVETPNDFGKTGTPPTHPELLEWLAGELVKGGWNLKPIHRLIMTSAAYQQSSKVDAAKLSADPDNRLFLRRVPQRLEGEALRDSILAMSGRLNRTPFGPGTKDPMSLRRSIYFTVKRSQLIPSMVAFDQPEPLASQGNRPVTTVPPQALYLMNNKAIRDAAEFMAEQWMKSHSKDGSAGQGSESLLKQWILSSYQTVVSRDPRDEEHELALRFLQQQIQRHHEDGAKQPVKSALADHAQVMFGLNEVIYQP